MEYQSVGQSKSARTGRQRVQRTGPVGRLARLVLAAAGAWLTYDLWIDRTAVFENTGPLDEPFLLALAAVVAYAVYDLAKAAGWGRLVLAVLAAVAVALIGIAWVTGGPLWAPPLTWLLWGVAVAGLVSVTLLLLIAVIVGTPGCELGIVREVLVRHRGDSHDSPMFCLAGLRAIDAWERRSWRAES